MSDKEKVVFKSAEEKDLQSITKDILAFAANKKVWTFSGDLGAGKTTLIKYLCQHLGICDTVNSPTFAIVNEYLSNFDKTIYHFDFYRISQQQEALDIGLYEYLDSGNFCFIEWPEKVKDLILEDRLEIRIEILEGQKRRISARHHE